MKTYFEFVNPVKIVAGYKALENIGNELEDLDAKHPMLIADKGIEQAGLLKKVLDAFAGNGIVIADIFTDVPPDSGIETVKKAVGLYREKNCDSIIAIGGGSVIDTAKGINILASLGGDDLLAYSGAGALNKRLNPFIVVPTTSGTGSEVTLVAVVMDHANSKKHLFVSPRLLPDVAILDPRMTITLPPYITAFTGMDALSHAIEAYTCIGKNPISDSYAITAIKAITEKLIFCVKNPSDAEARLSLAVAATCAGVAFSNSMVGLVHSLGHSLGAVCHVPHGVAMNIFLPHVLEFNLEKIRPMLGELLPSFSSIQQTLVKGKEAEAVINAIKIMQSELKDIVQLPVTLSATQKVTREQFPQIAETAINDASISYNPRECSIEQAIAILEKAF